MTFEQLITAILEELEERGAGQLIAAEDAQKVRDALPGWLADLFERNVILAPIVDPVEPSYFGWLTKFVAWKLARPFGLGSDAGLAADGQDAENKLRVLARINRGTGEPLKVDKALIPRRRVFYYGGYI